MLLQYKEAKYVDKQYTSGAVPASSDDYLAWARQPWDPHSLF